MFIRNFVALVVLSILLFSQTIHAQLIVVNSSVFEKEVTRTMLNSFLSLQRKNWSSGEKVVVFLLPEEHLTHQDLNTKILDTLPRHLRQEQERRIYSGVSNIVKVVKTESEMIQMVANTPGSIGYTHQTFDPTSNTDIMKSNKIHVVEIVER